jgi:hypothetical protein
MWFSVFGHKQTPKTCGTIAPIALSVSFCP